MRCRIRQGRIAGEILTRSEEMEIGPKKGPGEEVWAREKNAGKNNRDPS